MKDEVAKGIYFVEIICDQYEFREDLFQLRKREVKDIGV